MNRVLTKLKEKTTWLGIVSLLTLAGIPLEPHVADALGTLVASAAAVTLIFVTPKSK